MLKMMLQEAFRKIRKRYTRSEGLRKITHNTGWLFFDKILRMGVGLIVGVWVARYLGPQQYGMWNYSMAFASLFGALATLGLDGIVVRDLIEDPSKRDILLGTAFVLKLIAGLITLIVTVIFIAIIKQGDNLMLYLVALSSLGFVFQSFFVIDFYFQAHVISKYTVYAQNAAFLIVAFAKIGLLLCNAPLITFAIAGTVEIFLTSIFFILVYRKKYLSIFLCRRDLFPNILREDFSDPQLSYSTNESCLPLFPGPANRCHEFRASRP
jgi:polysaccharide transporter, PST family